MRTEKKLSRAEKAAIVLTSMNKSTTAEILRELDSEEIEKITYMIATTGQIDSKERLSVLNEFYEMCLAQGYISGGGLEYAKEILTEALGAKKCIEIIGKLSSMTKPKPFNFLNKVDADEISNFLRNERNQTIALIMSYMEPEQAALVLSLIEPVRQSDIVQRIAEMDKISPDVIQHVEEEVKMKLDSFYSSSDYTDMVGVNIVADILSSVDRGTEMRIFEQLENNDYKMAEEIRKKMFVFEDIVSLDRKSLQKILSRITHNDLALAMKSTTDDVINLILNNISQRAKEIVRQEIDMMGAVRLSEVLEAQQAIVNTILEMEKNQEIIIVKGESDKLIE